MKAKFEFEENIKELEERIEEAESAAEDGEGERNKLKDKIDELKKDKEGLEDNIKKVRGILCLLYFPSWDCLEGQALPGHLHQSKEVGKSIRGRQEP